MKRAIFGILALGAALLAPAGAAEALTVSAAASLTEAMREIGPKFEAAHPGLSVRFNFGASGQLLQQIAQGAPVDVLVSADEETVARGVELKVLAPASVRVVAANALVLIKPSSGGAGVEAPPTIASLKDLARPEVKRIAIGKPTSVPAGRYSQQALVSAQLWDALQTKIVPADNVRQVLDYVARGEVDAGLVYATDAAQLKDKVQVVSRLEGHAPIRYPAAQVSESRQAASAKEFIQFLTEAAAQEVLRSRGFLAP